MKRRHDSRVMARTKRPQPPVPALEREPVVWLSRWDGLRACPACLAPASTPCLVLSPRSKATFRIRPHVGRPGQWREES